MYFDQCTTLAELKAEYRRLALLHHPDHGGDVATMQEINAEHDRAFSRLKAAQDAADDAASRPHSEEAAEDFRRVIAALMPMRGITIELCGAWLWITGNTRPHAAGLKAAGCYWAHKKRAWYWRPAGPRIGRHREKSLSEIRAKYGSQTLREEERGAPPARRTA